MKFKILRNPGAQAATLLVLSVLLGLGTYLYLVSYQARVDASNEMTPVLVAKSEIPLGTSLGEIVESDLFVVKNLPKDSIPMNALSPDITADDTQK